MIHSVTAKDEHVVNHSIHLFIRLCKTTRVEVMEKIGQLSDGVSPVRPPDELKSIEL